MEDAAAQIRACAKTIRIIDLLLPPPVLQRGDSEPFDSFRFAAETDFSALYARVIQFIISFLILSIKNYNIFMCSISELGVLCVLCFCFTFERVSVDIRNYITRKELGRLINDFTIRTQNEQILIIRDI